MQTSIKTQNFEHLTKKEKKDLYLKQDAALVKYKELIKKERDYSDQDLEGLKSWNKSNAKKFVRFGGPEYNKFIETIAYFHARKGNEKRRFFSLNVKTWKIVQNNVPNWSDILTFHELSAILCSGDSIAKQLFGIEGRSIELEGQLYVLLPLWSIKKDKNQSSGTEIDIMGISKRGAKKTNSKL